MEEKKQSNTQIFIARLHPRVTQQDIKYKFQKYGDIKDIRLKPGYAFVDFESSEDAEKAVDRMNGKELEGQRIVVEISKRIYREKDGDRRVERRERDPRRDREERDGSNPRKRGPKPEDSCFNCGKPGHWANECREAVKPRREFRDRDQIECFQCGEKGHKQMYCPKKRGRSNSRDRYRRRASSSSSRRSRKSSRSSSRSKRRNVRRRSPSRSSSSSSYSRKNSPRRSPQRNGENTSDVKMK